ncbi:hypothetical protein P3711_25460, partial [Vibrio parahaemolyticus]|nr:hypothetical protein [Vibrio parahaemolyticus]
GFYFFIILTRFWHKWASLFLFLSDMMRTTFLVKDIKRFVVFSHKIKVEAEIFLEAICFDFVDLCT